MTEKSIGLSWHSCNRECSESAERRTEVEENPITHYVIVRADLPRGIQAAQIIHAAGESSPGNLAEGTFAVALVVPDENALMNVAARLIRARVAFVPVYEPDAPYKGALMAVGIVPGRKEDLRRHLSSLPLLR